MHGLFDPGHLNMAFKFGKTGRDTKSGSIKASESKCARFPASGEIRISRAGSCSPNVSRHALALPICLSRSTMSSARGWLLSYSVRLWRGRIGTIALPLVDFLQRSYHERCLVVLGQAFGVAERRDALPIGQHADRPRPVGAPHATIQPERIDDPHYRLPDIVVWERLVRHRAGNTDLYHYVLVLSQGEQLWKIGPNVGGDRRAGRLQQAEMVDHDDRIAVSRDVRQCLVQDPPAKQIDRQAI